MARFFRSAVHALVKTKGLPHDPRPYTGLFLATSKPSGPDHLGLARTRWALRDLNALLTPKAFLLDATYVLGAAVLRIRPQTDEVGRVLRDVVGPQTITRAEARGNTQDATAMRIIMTFIDAKDGSRSETSGSPASTRTPGVDWFHHGIVAATLGRAPGALAAGSKHRVASAACHIILNQWGMDAGMPISQIVAIAFLMLAAGGMLKRNGMFRFLQVVHDGINSISGRAGAPVSREANNGDLLDTFQALLSTVVLRAPPLSGERICSAVRVAERDLACAVEQGDASATASLRLLLAFLAARGDGQFEYALERYTEMARDNPSDKWVACGGVGQDELVIALALGDSALPSAEHHTSTRRSIINAAASRVDAALVSALQDKEMSIAGRLEVRAVRTFMHGWVWSALKELEGEGSGSANATE
ncbi:hypothetical protein PR202_ga31259 [Eleusine coracana subsp. coracana]|uniref:Uncharacterized protein n=1 Tax=Eleusine coracana subsp. coracana TaxID=191504 RepID=A0AAV5DR21_ELECO|nr:hypothetical protein PR202_ga31259 [Eleusine coracana subsp. coracana]